MGTAVGDHPRSRLWGHRHLVVHGAKLPTYVVFLYGGCVVGTWAGIGAAEAAGLGGARFALAVAVLLVPALVGSRLWFALGHLDDFRSHPGRLWRRGQGGSALYGGLLLAIAVSVPMLAAIGLPFWAFWDAATVTMAVGLVLTRVGCAVNGCCTGRPTTGPLGAWMPDTRGTWARRYPSPLLEAGWVAVLIAGMAVAGSDLPFSGARITVVVALYALGRAVLGPLRAADRRARRANVVVSLGLAAAAVATAAALA